MCVYIYIYIYIYICMYFGYCDKNAENNKMKGELLFAYERTDKNI